MKDKIRIFQFNGTSILIEFDSEINESLLQFILRLKENIVRGNSEHILQVNTAYNSLLVIYKSTINNFYTLKNQLLQLISQVDLKQKPDLAVRKIPVCYEEDFGWDLQLLSEELELSKSEIIRRHTKPVYTVYFIGFLPGFPYLGDLDKRLYHRRKSQPRTQISAGSVGIADKQTGIYPSDSPGGWQIIGRSPVTLFDPNQKKQMCYLKAGDKIQFEAISREEFESFQTRSKEHKFLI
ncbi:5-oxoprolinase subunit PxpB [Psychroflexus sediminis]|uniref:Inhibitor of KinA n=1 Tax=Psychroflexus sediminis TaxID=470826 RepID=A0A1G7WQI3_9FLAO|nr:5-oxoprolinase subunit PxpB [Psychroflexus sediminis]SDG73500.1 inhibitor of KinA [Psychroflexus sediminis]